ncbi:tripeptidyl-peptidase-like protein [Lophium mytilinum]|uniref:tripeptidyl-peptidase II n=1 Tax=Lophium mytilinum TaxID=390894 RepID=A0A6A6Q896_9PEZI|nr:tripeptidyl-peptidase-like protein [Lophium mytilinum]
MEKLRGVPEGWKAAETPNPSRRMHFRIALTKSNQALFEQSLIEVSTPEHARYGQHLKRDELKDMLRPSPEATVAVIEWLRDSNVRSEDIEEDGEWINFVASVSTAEKMMDAKFTTYRSLTRSTVKKTRTLQYSVPKELHSFIDMIQPTTRFGQIRANRYQYLSKEIIGAAGTGLNVTQCNTTVTPACLRDLYKFGTYKIDPKAGSKLGVNGFLEEYALFADLAQFNAEYAPWAVGSNFTWTSVHGGVLPQNTQNDSVEANLDIQYTVPLTSPGTATNFYSTAGRGELIPDLDQPNPEDNENEPYLDFFTFLTGLKDEELPQTLTTSYGEDEQSVPEQYSKTVCDLIGQLGARGVSVLFSSGDTGVGSACQTNDGKNTTRFLPTFPASCPYVTAVGGTHYVEPESAIYFSSGGFSDRFPRPSYQDKAVGDYLKILGDRWSGLYNPAGRGIPDIAAQGTRFRVIDKGVEISVGGTSASAPTVASVVSLLNNARLSAGKPPLGFLNPLIYSKGFKGLNDVTTGGSTGCTGRDIYSGLPAPFVPYASWNATKGWDPVTGYGTPDFEKLLKIVLGGGYGGYRRS